MSINPLITNYLAANKPVAFPVMPNSINPLPAKTEKPAARDDLNDEESKSGSKKIMLTLAGLALAALGYIYLASRGKAKASSVPQDMLPPVDDSFNPIQFMHTNLAKASKEDLQKLLASSRVTKIGQHNYEKFCDGRLEDGIYFIREDNINKIFELFNGNEVKAVFYNQSLPITLVEKIELSPEKARRYFEHYKKIVQDSKLPVFSEAFKSADGVFQLNGAPSNGTFKFSNIEKWQCDFVQTHTNGNIVREIRTIDNIPRYVQLSGRNNSKYDIDFNEDGTLNNLIKFQHFNFK